MIMLAVVSSVCTDRGHDLSSAEMWLVYPLVGAVALLVLALVITMVSDLLKDRRGRR